MGDDGAGRLEKNRHLFQCVGVIFVMKLCERARLIKSVFFVNFFLDKYVAAYNLTI